MNTVCSLFIIELVNNLPAHKDTNNNSLTHELNTISFNIAFRVVY